MEWIVRFTSKARKGIKRLIRAQRKKELETLQALIAALESSGPIRGEFANYSKLGNNNHHCHLSHHYVCCWKVLDNVVQIMEVYYVGSREKAPY